MRASWGNAVPPRAVLVPGEPRLPAAASLPFAAACREPLLLHYIARRLIRICLSRKIEPGKPSATGQRPLHSLSIEFLRFVHVPVKIPGQTDCFAARLDFTMKQTRRFIDTLEFC
jgi:hypothetical protein